MCSWNTRRGVKYLWSGWPRDITEFEDRLSPGEVKMGYLSRELAPTAAGYAAIYAVSSTAQRKWDILLPLANISGYKIVWNQNGLYYPAWGATHWRILNARMGYLMSFAAGIIYQSHFCRRATERLVSRHRFFGPQRSVVLLNPVDTERFVPPRTLSMESENVVLTRMGNSRDRRYRNILALEAMQYVWKKDPTFKIRFIGAKKGPERDLLQSIYEQIQLTTRLPLDALTFGEDYTRQEAPIVMQQGSVWLHTAYCDPCPNIVAEALATGLPVVFLNNGGTPELVGDGGIGIPCEENFEFMTLPRPEQVGDAILTAFANRTTISAKARRQACEQLSIADYTRKTRQFLVQIGVNL